MSVNMVYLGKCCIISWKNVYFVLIWWNVLSVNRVKLVHSTVEVFCVLTDFLFACSIIYWKKTLKSSAVLTCLFLFPVKVLHYAFWNLTSFFFFYILFSLPLHFFWIDLLSFSFIVFPSTNLKAIHNTTILSAFTLKFNIHTFKLNINQNLNLPSKHCRKFLITLSPITLCPTCYSSFVF